MYPPPPDDVVKKLIGGVLNSISHGKYIVFLNFDNSAEVDIEAPFQFGEKGLVADSPQTEFPQPNSNLVRLLGESVVDAHCAADATLTIEFSNGDALVIPG